MAVVLLLKLPRTRAPEPSLGYPGTRVPIPGYPGSHVPGTEISVPKAKTCTQACPESVELGRSSGTRVGVPTYQNRSGRIRNLNF
eukprot:2657537-Rhodomonas_salina.1